MNRLPALCILTAILLFLAADCNKKMDDDAFIRLYVQIARATEGHLDQPDTLKAVHERIYAESGYTPQEFEGFKDKYKDQPEKWLKIWQQIEAQLKASPPPKK